MSELVLRLKPESNFIEVTKNFGDVQQIKNIKVSDLQAAMTTGMTMQTGLLVRGTRFYFGGPTEYLVGIETVPKTRGVFFGNNLDCGKEYNVPFPPCLFIFKVRNEVVNGSRCFAMRNSIMSFNDALYKFPFGNVYGDGNICWGDAFANHSVSSPLQLGSFLAGFFDSPYNGDLQEGAFRQITPEETNTQISGVVDIFEYLDNKDKFDYDLLQPSGYIVKDIISLLGGTV